MATPDEIAQAMTFLVNAYPNFELAEGTAELYFSKLSEYPADVLAAAVEDWVTNPVYLPNSRFFPSLPELLQVVRQTVPPMPPVDLRSVAFALEDAHYHDGSLDETTCRQLIRDFRHANRPYAAAAFQVKFDHFKEQKSQKEPPASASSRV